MNLLVHWILHRGPLPVGCEDIPLVPDAYWQVHATLIVPDKRGYRKGEVLLHIACVVTSRESVCAIGVDY